MSSGLTWDIGEALMVGEWRTYLGNNLLERQHTECQRYPDWGLAANQSAGPLYNKIRRELSRGLDLPTIGKKLFVDLEKRTAKELNVSNCWVCGGALMMRNGLLGTTLNAYQLLLWNQSITRQENS
jgi:hypothetical protein